ncbi:hypothetical protein LJC56_07880 [Christensenellaceae bacterium OttesenSCG-928-K19]|nr:hypothetical protein [Christensenellaceae bacterium OttesenSCG-928-K19]
MKITLKPQIQLIIKLTLLVFFSFFIFPDITCVFLGYPDLLISSVPAIFLLAWLFQYIVKGEREGFVKQKVLFTVCAVAIALATNYIFIGVFGFGDGLMAEYRLYAILIGFLAVIAMLLLLFFVFGKRKFALVKKEWVWIVNGVSLVLLVLLCANIVVITKEYTPLPQPDYLDLLDLMSIYGGSHISILLVNKQFVLCSIVFLLVFLLLWINTKGKVEDSAEDVVLLHMPHPLYFIKWAGIACLGLAYLIWSLQPGFCVAAIVCAVICMANAKKIHMGRADLVVHHYVGDIVVGVFSNCRMEQLFYRIYLTNKSK